MATYVVLLGPPGAGKGTQAEIISEELGLPHVSSGDLFRENIKDGTQLGKVAEEYMNRGELVPDDVTIAMVRDKLSGEDAAGGAILDGFPRTPAQAAALEKILSEFNSGVSVVPYIKVPEQVLIERLAGRLTCRAEGHVYHEKYNPPEKAGVCDIDGSELYEREDDNAETVTRRIRVYLEQTQPLIDYYRQLGLLVEVDGTSSIESVTEELKKVVRQNPSHEIRS